MNRSKIKFSQLRALVAVAQHHHFGEAALQLELSQPAVSHAIATLEEELGVQLVLRGRYGARLTPIGQQIVDRSQEILQLLETIYQEADLQKGLHGGQVRVASFRSVATQILPGIMAQFHRQYPNIQIIVTEQGDRAEVDRAVREGRADIGFTYLPTSEEFEAWEILRDEFVALLPATEQHPTSPLRWQELMRYPLILYPEENSCFQPIRDRCSALGLSLRATYRFRETSTIVSMVKQGLGAALVARLSVEPLPEGVCAYPLPGKPERILGVAILAETLHPPSVFAFLDMVKSCCDPFNPIPSTR